MNEIPVYISGEDEVTKAIIERLLSYCSPRMLTHSIAMKSRNVELRAQVGAQGKASKGPEYNDAILPFVKNIWNIDEAMKNSDSLSRMVLRLKRLSEQVA